MKFQPNPEKGAITVECIEGSLNRFDGKTLSIGYGKEKSLTRRKFVLYTRKIVSLSKQNRLTTISVDFKDLKSLAPADFSDAEVGKISATSFVMANYEHTKYKRAPKDGFASVEVVCLPNISKEGIEGAKKGHWIAEEVNACRELANTPGGDLTPKQFSALAKKTITGANTKVTVLGRKEMEKLGMGGVVGIGKGSDNEPQFVAIEYWGAGKPNPSPSTRSARSGQQAPLVLVGKGVTFDSGGLNLKPGDHMYEMHMDMSGGAAVLYTLALAVKLKLKVNVVGLIPTVENMPGQNAVRPGDQLKSMSGRYIEVLNTDAEGRVILADGITYAKKYNPAVVVDVATLTGAALTALGTQCSAIMSNDQNLEDTLRELGEESGDYVWPFPAWEEYEDMTKGMFGDVPNISTDGNSRYGGVIAGGMFLREFAKDLDCPWAHIDMAPRMTSTSGEHLAKGAAGAPVRLLLAFVEKYANTPARKN
jgi:leucyl aminopeptidase